MIYILAETHSKAKDYARAKSLRMSDVRIIGGLESLRGLRHITVRLVGTFWKRPEWHELQGLMRYAGITTEEDRSW